MKKTATKRGKGRELQKKLASFLQKNRAILLGALGVLFVIALILLATGQKVRDVSSGEEGGIFTQKEVIRHPLTGEELKEPLNTLPTVISVMIENAADSWPLSGLNDAFMVIEAPVEGNIPRFIAFYEEDARADKIGPVRSARPYYVDWATMFEAVYAHVGGSPEALELIPSRPIWDLNQFFESEYFYRENSSTRFAPHNVFTSSSLLRLALEELQPDEPAYEGFTFGAESNDRGSISPQIEMGAGYDITWLYDEEMNEYVRLYGAQTEVNEAEYVRLEDRSNIQANTIVVLEMPVATIDAIGRKRIETVGTGNAYIFKNGNATPGIWERLGQSQAYTFVGYDGEELTLNPGTTWMQIVSSIDTQLALPGLDE